MLFDDEARTKLDAIIHGAAVGETVGLLASRMSEAERAEKFTPEEIHRIKIDHSQNSTSVELLKATIAGLECANSVECPTNLEIRIHLHQAYRDWATTSPSASKFRNHNLVRAMTSGQLGSFTSMERAAPDGMLRIAPIGLAFAGDPGRAFLIGSEAAALADGDFNSYLGAGVVSLIVALIVSGALLVEAVKETMDFIRPLDWPGEISEALRRSLEPDNSNHFCRGSVSETLKSAMSAVHGASSLIESFSNVLAAGGNSDAMCLAGQLSGCFATN